ncbi:MAG: T9SS type A sorting domain-containing protein, partial [Ignavibacteriota bacterium]
DGGLSFSSILNYPLATLSGCIAITPGVIYLPTRSQGILESTDSGTTWVTASGPSFPIDCHDIISIDDTILLAADNVGTIWRSIDPRGASPLGKGVLNISPSTIQFPDSVSPCGPAARTMIYVSRNCRAPLISSLQLSGKNIDSKYFRISGLAPNDSVLVEFFPDSARIYAADLEVTLDDGSIVSVPLQGFGKTPQILKISSADIHSDFIGETVSIPIISAPPIAFGGLDLSIHFDTSMMIYRGTFVQGSKIDQTIQTSAGFARVHFDETNLQTVGDTIGFAEFDIYPTHTPCTTVVFDSLSLTNGKGILCGIAEPSFSSLICSNIICGTEIVSNFIRYQQIPFLSITPNPSSGRSTIHSDIHLDAVKIFFYDQVGRLQYEEENVDLSAGHALNLQSLPAGFYSVHVRSAQLTTTVPFLLIQ